MKTILMLTTVVLATVAAPARAALAVFTCEPEWAALAGGTLRMIPVIDFSALEIPVHRQISVLRTAHILPHCLVRSIIPIRENIY